MAKRQSVNTITPISEDFAAEIENYLQEEDPNYVAPTKEPEPTISQDPDPLTEELKTKIPGQKEPEPTVEAQKEPTAESQTPTEEQDDFLLELEPDTTSTNEPDWDFVAKETGIEATGKEVVISQLKKIAEENKELKSQVEQVKNISAVSDTIHKIDNLLSMDMEALVRMDMKEIKGWEDEDVEAEMQHLIDSGTLDAKYRQIKYELRGIRQNTLSKAEEIRKQQEAATSVNNVNFQNTAKERIKSISTINGLSFNSENLQKVQSRAEQILVSKEFQDKLKNPDYIAELAFREATGKALDKMLENKFKNKAKNELLNQFGNPSRAEAKGVHKPQAIEAKGKSKDEMAEFAESDEFSIGR